MKAFLFCVGAFLLGLCAIAYMGDGDKTPVSCKHCGGDGVIGDSEIFYMCGECWEPVE